MTYILRDRPDGMVEIVMSRPVLVGIFPDSDVAAKVYAFLSDEPELPDDRPANFAAVATDAANVVADTADLIRKATEADRPKPKAAKLQLPAVVEKPAAPVWVTPTPNLLSDEDKAKAFARLGNGEKLVSVAKDFGVTFAQLRGSWASHKRHLQKFMAEDGQQACKHCRKPFTPSLTNPETCARCSK